MAGAAGRTRGRLADNVVHFARLLRSAGVPVGTDRVLLALRALQVAGLASRADLRATLRACLIGRSEHRAPFDEAFDAFWQAPDISSPQATPPTPRPARTPKQATESRRLAEAPGRPRSAAPAQAPGAQPPAGARPSWTDREELRKADFDAMTPPEWLAARRMVARLRPFLAELRTRRYAPSHRGARPDLRALLRTAARRGGETAELPRRVPRTRPEPLVVLVDISGSMSRYSRMFLHFVQAITGGERAADLRVHSFVFGTRLTPVTRALRVRDPDVALAEVVRAVDDWSGGTRIAHALREFNRRWARRVLAGRPTVLLVTDGLEHADVDLLGAEIARLARACRRLVWLNPLLRYESFEPRARGVAAMLPHVDAFLPVHNVAHLESLARVLADAGAHRGGVRTEGRAWN